MPVTSQNSTSLLPTHWQGAIWKILACTCFAGINGIVRYLSGGAAEHFDPLPVSVLAFFQNLFGALFILPWIWQGELKLPRSSYPLLHSIRILTAVLGVLLWYWALARMPIAQAVALSFTGPIFTVLGARVMLRENIGGGRFIAVLLSFIGSFMILRPDMAYTHPSDTLWGWPALLPLASAIAIAGSKLATRALGARGESPYTMTLYLLVFMIPVTALPAFTDWIMPARLQWAWLLLLGILAAGAHFSTSKAYALAEVTFLTPFGFARIFLSGLIGYIAFSEFPQHWTVWGGIAIILASVLIIGSSPSRISSLKGL